MKGSVEHPPEDGARLPVSFLDDFKRFFLRGLSAVLPTLITISLLTWVWGQLNEKLGRHITQGLRYAIKWIWISLSDHPAGYVSRVVDDSLAPWAVDVIGVVLAIVLVYVIGLFVGNFIGRTSWRLAEVAVMKIPLIRAIYPAVKQVTDFVLAEKSDRFAASRVVAVEPHTKGIWSIGLVTGEGLRPLSDAVGAEMVTVFVPSSPTAFSGYVLMVPRQSVIELPLSVDQAMRLLVSGGVIAPERFARLPDRSAREVEGASTEPSAGLKEAE